MTLRVSVEGGTDAGKREPYEGGHGPRCQCSKCRARLPVPPVLKPVPMGCGTWPGA